MSGDAAIHVEGLTRDFGKIRAIDHLSLHVPRGVIFGFLGANGAGKTTTLHLLLGLIEPSAGRAEVFGFDARSQGRHIRAVSGALLEHAGHYERLSAQQNLEFYGRAFGLRGRELETRILTLLERFGLRKRRHDRVGTWSRGMKQRLAVARALIHEPSLLFLDEPTTGLDPVAAWELRSDLASLRTSNRTTVFLTTHNLGEAEALCDRVAIVSRGRLLAEGTPAELRAQGTACNAEIRGSGFSEKIIDALRSRREITNLQGSKDLLRFEFNSGGNTPAVVRFLVESGAEVEAVHAKIPSLEEVFLRMTREKQ